MPGAFYVEPGELDGVARRLRSGSDSLEGASSPPPAPEAGDCTAPIAAVLAYLTESTAGVVEGVGAAGDAVAECNSDYLEADRNEAEAMSWTGPE